MSNRNVIVILVLLAALAWWFLHEDPEAEVRHAHQELARLLSKTEGEASNTMIFNAAVLKGMFADTCEVTGDAEMLAGSHTPEAMVSTIIQLQAMFLSVDLTFHELVIEFPAADVALVNFTAVLVGKSLIEGEEEAAETRKVVSRMRKAEGTWQFSEFNLAIMRQN